MRVCRIFLFFSFLYSSFALGQNSYQVDLLLFAQPQNALDSIIEGSLGTPFLPLKKEAIRLTQGYGSYYHLLSPTLSGLLEEYYSLHHTSKYSVLGNFSWKQPKNSDVVIKLPYLNTKGWVIKGTVKVQQASFYRFNSELQCSAPANPQEVFTVTQKQGLEADKVYYLDHAQIGMLVKIH